MSVFPVAAEEAVMLARQPLLSPVPTVKLQETAVLKSEGDSHALGQRQAPLTWGTAEEDGAKHRAEK